MVITIKEQGSRFGVRVAAIIFNHDMSRIFMQKQNDNDYYMFPGGRLEVHEDSKTAILRELDEELGIKENAQLKYITESFIQFPNNKKYHEIGFYFIVKIDEQKYNYNLDKTYNSLDEENDGKSEFVWLDKNELKNYKIMTNFMFEKIIDNNFDDVDIVEHLVYKEYK